jgi:hypothetical protein
MAENEICKKVSSSYTFETVVLAEGQSFMWHLKSILV